MNDTLYNFMFRGLLTEEALDRAGRRNRTKTEMQDEDIERTLGLSSLPEEFVDEARKMAIVYCAIAAFENMIRELVKGVLLEGHGESWWEIGVAQKIRERAEKRMDDERRVKWHTQRGDQPLNYTTMADLVNTMRNNFDLFEPHIHSIDWVANVFDAIERSRNVIMHSGSLEKGDIERLGVFLRDWIKQVGT